MSIYETAFYDLVNNTANYILPIFTESLQFSRNQISNAPIRSIVLRVGIIGTGICAFVLGIRIARNCNSIKDQFKWGALATGCFSVIVFTIIPLFQYQMQKQAEYEEEYKKYWARETLIAVARWECYDRHTDLQEYWACMEAARNL